MNVNNNKDKGRFDLILPVFNYFDLDRSCSSLHI